LKKNGEPDKKMIKVVIYAYFVNCLKQIDIEEEVPDTSTIFDQNACKKDMNKDVYGVGKTIYVISLRNLQQCYKRG